MTMRRSNNSCERFAISLVEKSTVVVEALPVISLEKAPKAVKKFFENLPNEPVLILHEGRAISLIQPAAVLVPTPAHRPGVLAGEVLKDVQGAWTDVSAEVCEAISGGHS
jgi:hypothetical protein